MSEVVRSGVFTLVMDRPITKKDLTYLQSWGFIFTDQKNDLLFLTFEDLEIMIDETDPRKLYCHGLKPVLGDGKSAECLRTVTSILISFVPGRETKEVSIKTGGIVQKATIPSNHVIRLENCILEAAGKGKAPDHPETPYIKPTVVQGLHTYTVFYRFQKPLLEQPFEKE